MSDDCNDAAPVCPICLEPTTNQTRTQCNHGACSSCTWRAVATHGKCWICRERIDEIVDPKYGENTIVLHGTDEPEEEVDLTAVPTVNVYIQYRLSKTMWAGLAGVLLYLKFVL